MPLKDKEAYLVYLVNSLAQNSIIIFTRTVNDASKSVSVSIEHASTAHQCTSYRMSIILRTLGFQAVPLHGQLSQSQRLGALGKFKSGGRKVLVATDVASR